MKDGQLIEGVIDKNTIGAERSETLFHRIVKDTGSEPGRIFLNGLIKLLDRFITLRGFTYGIDELDISNAVRDKISKAVKKAEEHVQELIEQYKKKTLERLPGRTVQESLELRIMDELSKARDQAGELAEQYLKTETDNSGVIMTKTGARGSMLNIAQMVATVGQQSIRGQRIRRGYRDRALSFFRKGRRRCRSTRVRLRLLPGGPNPRGILLPLNGRQRRTCGHGGEDATKRLHATQADQCTRTHSG